MAYRVLLSPLAIKTYKSASESFRERLDKAIEDIGRSPFGGPQIKRLKGVLKEYRRYRLGEYRILYALSKQRAEVYIDYIQHRREVYRH